MDIIIKVEDLSLGYGTRTVIQQASFEIKRGSIVALLGPNGSGKTTLLMALAGLIKPSSGRVLIEGEDAIKITAEERAKKVAVLPQSFSSFIPFTVFETVLMGRYPLSHPVFFYNKQDKIETENLLKLTGLWDMRDRNCTELSGGELQKVMLASVVAQETPILLLDEPTASLDIRESKGVMEMVKKLADKLKKTIVLATHDLNIALNYSTRAIIIMSEGKLIMGKINEFLIEETLLKAFGVKGNFIENQGKKFFLPE